MSGVVCETLEEEVKGNRVGEMPRVWLTFSCLIVHSLIIAEESVIVSTHMLTHTPTLFYKSANNWKKDGWNVLWRYDAWVISLLLLKIIVVSQTISSNKNQSALGIARAITHLKCCDNKMIIMLLLTWSWGCIYNWNHWMLSQLKNPHKLEKTLN